MNSERIGHAFYVMILVWISYSCFVITLMLLVRNLLSIYMHHITLLFLLSHLSVSLKTKQLNAKCSHCRLYIHVRNQLQQCCILQIRILLFEKMVNKCFVIPWSLRILLNAMPKMGTYNENFSFDSLIIWLL